MEYTELQEKITVKRRGILIITWFITSSVLTLILRLPPSLPAVPAWLTNRYAEISTKQILVKGAEIRGINDLEFGPDGMLYAASTLGNDVVIVHPQKGTIIERIDERMGVTAPSALTFGPDDTLYWASLLSGEVGRWDIDGEVRIQLVVKGIQVLDFSRDGKLYVSCGILGEKIFKLDPELIEPPHPINAMSGIDVVSGEVETGETNVINRITSDSQGHLYTARGWGQVERYDPKTERKEIIAQLPSGLGDVVLDAEDNVYVAGVQDGSIYRIFEDGQWEVLVKGGIVAPGGIAVLTDTNGDASIYVADFWTVREFNAKTGNPGYVENHQRGPSHIIPPTNLSADGENIILTSWASGVGVQVWNPQTHEVLESYSGFDLPIHAIRFQESLVVTELSSDLKEGRVVQLEPEGTVTLFDSSQGIQVPAGLAASHNNLWVSDWANGTIWQVAVEGGLLSTPIPICTGLDYPEGLAVDPDGNLLVVEGGAGRLSLIDLGTGERTTMVDHLAVGEESISDIVPPMWIFNGVAVGDSGVVYITGDAGNVVYKLQY